MRTSRLWPLYCFKHVNYIRKAIRVQILRLIVLQTINETVKSFQVLCNVLKCRMIILNDRFKSVFKNLFALLQRLYCL